MSDPVHIPVLASAALDLLAPQPGETAVDATTGEGGHTALLAAAVAPGGCVVAFDLDAASLERGLARARGSVPPGAVERIGVHDSFSVAAQRLRDLQRPADVLLADLGFSSTQMDDPARGLSFRADGPLDMRFDRHASRPTAADLVATLTEVELADVIFRYGEEPLARKIARKLAQSREREPIDTTARLAELVLEAYGARARASRMHPATRTFMALRIAVNEELDALRALLDSIVSAAGTAPSGNWLHARARIAVISFHSLEDRMVKRTFAEMAKRGVATRLTRRPIGAGDDEIRDNPRSRSARLRAIRLGGESGERSSWSSRSDDPHAR